MSSLSFIPVVGVKLYWRLWSSSRCDIQLEKRINYLYLLSEEDTKNDIITSRGVSSLVIINHRVMMTWYDETKLAVFSRCRDFWWCYEWAIWFKLHSLNTGSGLHWRWYPSPGIHFRNRIVPGVLHHRSHWCHICDLPSGYDDMIQFVVFSSCWNTSRMHHFMNNRVTVYVTIEKPMRFTDIERTYIHNKKDEIFVD